MSGFEGISTRVELDWNQCQVLLQGLSMWEASATESEICAFGGVVEGAREQLIGGRGVIECTSRVSPLVDAKTRAEIRFVKSRLFGAFAHPDRPQGGAA